jgi:hypothetical protein
MLGETKNKTEKQKIKFSGAEDLFFKVNKRLDKTGVEHETMQAWFKYKDGSSFCISLKAKKVIIEGVEVLQYFQQTPKAETFIDGSVMHFIPDEIL